VAYTALAGFVKNSQQGVYRLMTADVEVPRGTSRTLVPKLFAEYGISVSWSPDGRSLAYVNFGQLVRDGDAYVIAATGGEPRLVSRGTHPPLGHPYRAPLWSADGSQLYFLARNSIWRASIADGTISEIATIPGRTITEIVARGNNV